MSSKPVKPNSQGVEAMWQAWSDFCDRAREAGRVALRDDIPLNDADRAAGLKYFAGYLTKAIDEKVNYGRPDFPQLRWYQSPACKSFGDNPDCTYLQTTIDGAYQYRLAGNRGTVCWTAIRAGDATLHDKNLQTEWDGSFTVHIGGPRQAGNWLPLEPGPQRFVIRQFFGDWHLEEPMRVRLERVGQEGAPPPIGPEWLAEAFRDAIEWLEFDANRWIRWVDSYHEWPNQFVSGVPAWTDYDGNAASLDRSLHFCGWKIEAGEALLIKVKPPRCTYWNFELGNSWMNSLDYRYYFSSLNHCQSQLNPDGTAWIVVSEQDPRIANWLETATHRRGLLIQRWVEAGEHPCPEAQLLPFGKLDDYLPADTPRVSPAERRRQRRLRKVGVDRRFAV